MLKRRVVLAGLFAAAVTPVLAHGAPRGQATAKLNGKLITVDYGRPSLQGRDMLGRATPGEAWRMGADAATTLTTEANLSFGGTAVAKGSYILTATKDEKGTWTLNVRDGKDREKLLASVPLANVALQDSIEMFTIELRATDKDKGELELQWGTAGMKAAFTAK
jgi:hypothetical protein